MERGKTVESAPADPRQAVGYPRRAMGPQPATTRQPQGRWISHEMAAFPPELNKTLETKLVAEALRARLAALSESAASVPSHVSLKKCEQPGKE